MSEPVRQAVSRDAINAELTPERWIRSYRGVDIYVVDGVAAPAVMQEIGRVRELEFRSEGGGTGKAVDIDQFDTGEVRFRQLVSWDSENNEIVGMYRFLGGDEAIGADGQVHLPTSRLFEFSQVFVDEYLPYTVELGRSVVNRSAKRAIMGLFTAWAGLASIVVECPRYRHFFGKFTTYPDYNEEVRGALFRFLDRYCADADGLVRPRPELNVAAPESTGELFGGDDYTGDYQRLMDFANEHEEIIPPLVISYLGLSDTMRNFGTAINPFFGNVLETAIMVNIADIKPKQRSRFVDSYESRNPGALRV